MKPFLVFDLDGTLIDSAPDIVVAVNRTLEKFGKNAFSKELIISHIGEGLKKLISDIFADDHLNSQKAAEVESAFLKIYEEEMFTRTTVFPGVVSFLESYSGQIGIITNKNVRPAKLILNHLNLMHLPWVEIFGADSLPEKKPSPLPLKTIMKLASQSPENTFMIGDGLPDVQSARTAGVRSIAIEFGYTDLPRLMEFQPSAVLSHYNQLHDILNRLKLGNSRA